MLLTKSKGLRIWGALAVVNSPQFEFMSMSIQSVKLGRVAAAHGQYGHTGPTWSAFFYEKGGGSMPDLGVYNMATLTGLLGPAKSVMAMTSIVNPERTVDDKGKIKVEAEDNAHLLLEHDKGVISHVMCGFNYFDPHGHEAGTQSLHSIQIYGDYGNMRLVGYDWETNGVWLDTSTISRTIITHGSTQIMVLSVLLFGGETLYYFSLALTGICFGIYSSVLVASPLVMWLGVSREQFITQKKAVTENTTDDGACV